MRKVRALRLVLSLLSALVLTDASAKESTLPLEPGALAHALDRVAHTGRVLYVAAHPDDENTRLLAYLANARHLTVGYLSLTRGDGGQNLIGTEQNALLGIIRTQELLAARRMDGAVQFFTRARDFGYSKRADEALSQWGHEAVLSDVVRVYRAFQPDVVITRFDETPPNHGHHTASAILAREAMSAAADPKRFPEQLKQGLQPWKVTRLVHNVSPWRVDKPPADALSLDVGAYDPRLGLSYGELAALSRTQHKSQGFGSAGQRGPLLEHFTHVAGSRAEKELLEGIVVTWSRFGPMLDPLTTAFQKALDEARVKLTRDTPEAALPALLEAHAIAAKLPRSPRKLASIERLEQVILSTLGLYVRATSPLAAVAPGQKLPVKLEVVLRRPGQLSVSSVAFPGMKARTVKKALEVHAPEELTAEVKVAEDAAISAPYWLRTEAPGALYTVSDPALIGAPEAPAPLVVKVSLSAGKRTLQLDVPVVHVWTDPVQGERAREVMIAPPATVTPLRQAVMIVNGKPGSVALRVRGAQAGVKGRVRLPLPKGWSVSPAEQPIAFEKAGEETTVQFEVRAPADAAPVRVAPEVIVGKGRWSFREAVIDYPHLPMQVVLQPSSLRLVPLALEAPDGLVGYIEGPGDTVREDLAHVGARVERVDPATLRGGDLSRYAAILVGIRAYNTEEVLRAAHSRLMKYVENGGTVVVQYNTRSRFSPLETPVGPYPLEIGRDRVTDETAAMQPVDPKHPVLIRPNRLGEGDFEGWVQERGLYFGEKWDERYQPIFRIADPKEAPLLGSVLVTKHGKGRYVYTGLSFFRQLPAGVPGAYRLLANLMGEM